VNCIESFGPLFLPSHFFFPPAISFLKLNVALPISGQKQIALGMNELLCTEIFTFKTMTLKGRGREKRKRRKHLLYARHCTSQFCKLLRYCFEHRYKTVIFMNEAIYYLTRIKCPRPHGEQVTRVSDTPLGLSDSFHFSITPLHPSTYSKYMCSLSKSNKTTRSNPNKQFLEKQK
jgi:hypothetical protein